MEGRLEVEEKKYLDFLAKLGISSAHPGGMALTKMLLNYVKLHPSERILDVGCGTGETSVYIAQNFGSHVVAVDNHPLMVARAKERIKRAGVPVELHQANVEELPFQVGSFDKVLAESVTVFTDIKKALKEYNRVLKPGGRLIDVEMTSERFLTPIEESEIKKVYGINNVLTASQWEDALRRAGFQYIEVHHGIDFLQYNTEVSSAPSIDLSQAMDEEAFQVWLDHIQIMDKYKELNYRIYIAQA